LKTTILLATAAIVFNAAASAQAQQLTTIQDCVPVYSHVGTANYAFTCKDDPTWYVISQQEPTSAWQGSAVSFGFLTAANKVEMHKEGCRNFPATCQSITFSADFGHLIRFGVDYTATGVAADPDIDDGK
jgi:hypothetical protein